MANPRIDARGRWIPPLRPLAILLYCCAGMALVLEYFNLGKSRGIALVLGVVMIGLLVTGLGFHALSLWITRLSRDQDQV